MKKWYEHVIPKDGVRAFIAIVGFAALVAVMYFEANAGTPIKVPEWFIGMMGIVLGYYFGKESNKPE